MKKIISILLITSYLFSNNIDKLKKQCVADLKINAYNFASERENAKACFLLGSMYYYGDNVTKDKKKAIKYLRASCIRGFQKACIIVKRLD